VGTIVFLDRGCAQTLTCAPARDRRHRFGRSPLRCHRTPGSDGGRAASRRNASGRRHGMGICQGREDRPTRDEPECSSFDQFSAFASGGPRHPSRPKISAATTFPNRKNMRQSGAVEFVCLSKTRGSSTRGPGVRAPGPHLILPDSRTLGRGKARNWNLRVLRTGCDTTADTRCDRRGIQEEDPERSLRGPLLRDRKNQNRDRNGSGTSARGETFRFLRFWVTVYTLADITHIDLACTQSSPMRLHPLGRFKPGIQR
jgi:hypothetical protein